MKKALMIVLAVLVVIVALAIAAPFLVPVSAYKGRIIARVEQATGRKFAINGPIDLSFLPRTTLEVADVSLGNPPGMAGEMMTLGKLQLRANLFALLKGRLEVDSFVLVDPRIALAVDKDGRANWQFAAASPATPAPQPPSAPPKSGAPKPPAAAVAPQPAGGPSLSDIQLGDIRLVNGTLSYSDARTGQKQQIDAINAKLSLKDLKSPMQATADARWNGQKIDLTLDLAKPGALLAGEASAVALALAANPVKFDFKGTLAQRPQMQLAGATTLDVPSLKELAAWTGTKLPPTSGGMGPLKISGTFEHAGSRTSFKDAQIALDAMKAKGDLAVDTAGPRPALKGMLDIDRLDLNPYLPPEQPAAAPGASPQNAAAPAPKPAAPAAGGAPAGKPAPTSAAGGWSDAPIDVSGLSVADADFALSAGGIQFHKIKIGASALALHLKDAKLALDLSKMQLYGGGGKGSLKLDGAGPVPALDAAFTLDKVEAEPLLKDAMDFDRVKGSANAEVTLQSQGKSERELIAALGGKGSIRFADGAVKGINIGALVKNLANTLLNAGAQANEQTEFSNLTGTFTITKGILDNKDLLLKAPLLSATGAGTVDLPQRTVDYLIKADAAGLTVPIAVTGPWSDLKYRPQPEALLKNPGQALKGIEGALKGIAPNAPPPQGSPAPSGSTPKPADILRGLFGAPKN
ncbi:MAG TPA: AsmA family protein [Stellaceae bacterium]|nr:AsmA family protein [Stellaceae bacterium]